MTCSVNNCDEKHYAKSYCYNHYSNWKRYGSALNMRKFGLSKLPEYASWEAMKTRCLNPNSTRYKYYGGRGITICSQWVKNFSQFFADMGPKPSPKHSIDRIDNEKGYYPDNCRWATPSQQNQNRRAFSASA